MEWIKKHKILTGIIVIVILAGIGGATGGSKTGTTSQSTSTAVSPSTSTKAKLDIAAFYAKVENGMTKDQVLALTDKDPGNCTESETQGLGKYEMCTWYGNLGDSAFATVSFQDGKVNSKTKTGF